MAKDVTVRFLGDTSNLKRATRSVARDMDQELGGTINTVSAAVGSFGSLLTTMASSAFPNLADSVEEMPKKFGDFVKSADKAGAAISSLGPAGVPVLLGLAAAALAVAVPLEGMAVLFSATAFSIAAAAVVLAGFTVGLAGLLALTGTVAIGLAGLAAGVVLLANATGQVNGPMQDFKDTWQVVGSNLGLLAAGPATEILRWLTQLAPLAQSVGSQLIVWFGSRLDGVLSIATGLVRDLFGAIERVGPQLGSVFDQVIGSWPRIRPLFDGFLDFATSTLVGLLRNLVKLSDWFLSILPSAGPEVQQIFDFLGSAVQQVAAALAGLVGWFVDNFPTIIDWTRQLWQAFMLGGQFLGPIIALVVAFVQQLLAVPGVLDGLQALVAIFGGALVAALLAVSLGLAPLIVGFTFAAAVIGSVVNIIKSLASIAALALGPIGQFVAGMLGIQSSTKQASTAAGQAKISTDSLSLSQINASIAEQRHKQAVDALRQSLMQLPGTELAVEQATQRLKEANDQIATAQQNYNDVVAQYGPTSAQATQAGNQLKDAELGEKQAALDAANAKVQYAVTQAKANGTTLDGTQQAEIFAAALQDEMNKYPGLAAWIQTYIDKINNIPTERTTVVRIVTVNDQGAFAGNGTGFTRAGGGPVDPKHVYLVGEQGPELFMPKHAGEIISNTETKRLLGGMLPENMRALGGSARAAGGAATAGGDGASAGGTRTAPAPARTYQITINIDGATDPVAVGQEVNRRMSKLLVST